MSGFQRQLWSSEAEQSVVGALLLDERAFDDVQAVGLLGEHFYDARNREIYSACAALAEARTPIDVVTVAEYLGGMRLLDAVGGAVYLNHLLEYIPSVDNAVAYARLVMEFSVERAYLHAAQQMMQCLLDDGYADHQSRLAQLQQILTVTERNERQNSVLSLPQALKAMVDHIDQVANNPGIHGLLTGFQHVDYRLGGGQPGEFHIWAGRPAMGKTAYALNAARHMAGVQKKNGMVFSLEMPTRQLVQRMTAAEGKVKLGLLKSGKVLTIDEQTSRFGAAVTTLAKSAGQLFFDDQASLPITELVARAKRQHRKTPLDFVIVDHIGLVESTLKTDNETLRVGQVSRALKKLAKDLGCVVIGLSQVNRDCEKRANKRPMMSDLRMSGSLEQDADVIQFLYRDEYYNENTQYPGQVEVISAKLRDGEPGTDYLVWMGSYNRMEGMDKPGMRQEREEGEDFV